MLVPGVWLVSKLRSFERNCSLRRIGFVFQTLMLVLAACVTGAEVVASHPPDSDVRAVWVDHKLGLYYGLAAARGVLLARLINP